MLKFSYYSKCIFLTLLSIQINTSDNYSQIKNIFSQQSDTSILISNVRVDLIFPKDSFKRTILVLPGWNFRCDDICKKSDFCELAKNEGFVLIMPDMLKSIYASQLYPETRKDWLQYPTLHWITDTLIPIIQSKYKLLMSKQNNYLFGISTGARGVAMLAIYTNSIFIAGAGFSGDYNQLEMKDDNLVRGYYGSFEQFPERWTEKDNLQKNADKLKIPLFLAHGKADKVVPYTQTLEFYNSISRLNPGLNHKIYLNDTAGHNYAFWQSGYKNALKFFKENSLKSK
jgi:S-formylglutathione hydrolase FrmB